MQLASGGEASKALEEDYVRMVEDGLHLEDAEPFEGLMARCADIAERANLMRSGIEKRGGEACAYIAGED